MHTKIGLQIERCTHGVCALQSSSSIMCHISDPLPITLIANQLRHLVKTSLHPESQSTKKKIWPTYDEMMMKLLWRLSKCLAWIKGCWDPEFKPSIEEIMDYRWYMVILSVRFLWRARTLGDFPIQSSTWQVKVTSGSTGSSRAPNIRVYGACAVCRCVRGR